MNNFIVSAIISSLAVFQVQIWINPKKKVYLLYHTCIIALLTYLYLLATTNVQKIIITLISFIIIVPICIKSYKQMFYCKMHNLVIQAIVSSVCIYFSEFIHLKYSYILGPGRIIFSISVILSNLLWCIVMYLLRRYLITLMPYSEKSYKESLVFCIILYIPFLIITWGFDKVIFPIMAENLHIALVMFIVFAICALMYNFINTQRVLISEQNLKAIDIQSKLYKKYMVDMQSFRNEMRIMQHDSKHLIDNILALLENNCTDDAISQLKKMKEKTINNKEKYFCKNPSINAILIEASKNAEKNSMKFETTIRLEDEIYINDIDLSIVILNALSNAFEYCLELPESIPREVKCSIYTAGGFFVLQTENYILEKPVIIDGTIQTNKEFDKNLHGIGLESIRHTAKLYNGMSKIEANDNIFKLKVIIENKSINEDDK